MFKWFKKLKYIVNNYDELAREVNRNTARADYAVSLSDDARRCIKERTQVHADISPMQKDPHLFIAVGSYRGKDYVQGFAVQPQDFRAMMDQLKSMQKYGEVHRIDHVPSFSGCIESELRHDPWWE